MVFLLVILLIFCRGGRQRLIESQSKIYRNGEHDCRESRCNSYIFPDTQEKIMSNVRGENKDA